VTDQIAHTRRVISTAIVVFAISIAMTLASYAWDWIDAVTYGEGFEPDEWFAIVAAAWLPVVAAMVVRLVLLQRGLAATAQDALDAFRDTAQTTHGWVWRIDADGRIAYSSPGVLELLGYRTEEVIGRAAVDLLVIDEDRAMVAARAEEARNGAGWDHWRTRLRHRDGSIRHVVSSALPVRDSAGRFVGFRGFTSDVTGEVLAAEAEQMQYASQSAARERIEQVLTDPSTLHMALQPIVDLGAQRVVGVEALARFTPAPQRPPNVWFDEAWQVGLGPDLELHAVALAVRQLPQVPDGAYLSVNLSPRTIVDPRLVDVLAGLGTDAARVVIEVTEHAVVDDYDAIVAVLDRLADDGVRFAVDDAGAGYASMQHILRLRPHIIKLDRSIVANAHNEPARRALLGAMGTFASSLGVMAVAEGVENADELATLHDAGITTAQGFYLARPEVGPVTEWAGIQTRDEPVPELVGRDA
jgi:PAS domain S-box-containing protein